MHVLRRRLLLRITPSGAKLFAFGAASGEELLGGVEQPVVRLREASHVREVSLEEEGECGEDRAAKRKDAFLLSLPIDTKCPASEVEVPNLDTTQLAAADAEFKQTVEGETVAGACGLGEELSRRVERKERRGLLRDAGPANLGGRAARYAACAET